LRASVQLSQTEIHFSRRIKRASGATSKGKREISTVLVLLSFDH
jgi:hypothetical protein